MAKVCHMTSAHAPEDPRIFYKECTSLAQAGYEVYLVERGESYEKNGVHIVGVGAPPAGRLKRMTSFAGKVYQTALALDADIYHLHDPELLPWGMKLKRKGKKVVFDSHEMYAVQIRHKGYLPPWARTLAAAAYGAYERHVLRAIDALVNPGTLADGRHPFEGRCRRLTTLNNVPRLEELYGRYDESIPKRERSVVHVGTLTHSRGITNLIQAAAKADCAVYLAGTFRPASYQAELEALPEYAHVQYMGRLSRGEILELLQSCRIGASTLLNVGQYPQAGNLPTKVYEYMSLGLPVILSDTPYNRKAVERYRFGVCVDPDDIAAQADAMRCLLDHPEEAREMGENGRRAVREEFNWGVEEKKLLALYEDILNEI